MKRVTVFVLALVAFASPSAHADDVKTQDASRNPVAATATLPCALVDDSAYSVFGPKLTEQKMPKLFGFVSEVFARKGGELRIDWTGSALVLNTGQGKAKISHTKTGKVFYFTYDDKSEFELYFAVVEGEEGDEYAIQCRPAPKP